MIDREDQEIDARLGKLRDATSTLAPRPDFAARVMSRAAAPRGLAVVLPFSRRAVVAAALAAAASVAFAVRSEITTRADATAGMTESDDIAWWEP